MHLTRLSRTGLGVALLTMAACDKGTAPPRPSPDAEPSAMPTRGVDAMPAAPIDEAPVAGAGADAGAATTPAAASTGSVTGVIKFTGAAPAMPVLDRSRDPNCPQDELRAGWVSLGAGGALRDAVVHFAPGAVKDAAPARAQGPATIDQKGCVYRPAVVGVVKGQKLRVKNSDPTAHNVRGMNGDDQLFNEMHMASAPDKLLPADAEPGKAVQLRCDIHPWMATWVYVSDNSLYSVTGADGKFSIEAVPAGKYELEVWHPYLGKKTAKITVKAGETTTAALPAFGPADYKAPQ